MAVVPYGSAGLVPELQHLPLRVAMATLVAFVRVSAVGGGGRPGPSSLVRLFCCKENTIITSMKMQNICRRKLEWLFFFINQILLQLNSHVVHIHAHVS